jgi:hypothetical protein
MAERVSCASPVVREAIPIHRGRMGRNDVDGGRVMPIFCLHAYVCCAPLTQHCNCHGSKEQIEAVWQAYA